MAIQTFPLIGSLTLWPHPTIPSGYLEADGSTISRITYRNLFKIIGTSYGVGDGATTFNLPDFRGYFPRFNSGGSGIDPDSNGRTNRGDGVTGDNVGTKQNYSNLSHFHTYQMYSVLLFQPNPFIQMRSINTNVSSLTTTSIGGAEVRPTNITIIGLIKY